MDKRLNELLKLSKDSLPESRKYFKMLKKKTPNNLDVVMKELHEKEFQKTDCLTCGNCCKTTSPIFTSPTFGWDDTLFLKFDTQLFLP